MINFFFKKTFLIKKSETLIQLKKFNSNRSCKNIYIFLK